MAFLGPSTCAQVPLFHQFPLEHGMELQVNVSGFSNGKMAKVEFQLKNSSRTWILHWGCTYHGNTNWFIPSTNYPSGTKVYKQTALQTPFMKNGEVASITIQLRDPKIRAIEFLLKDGRYDKWLKLNKGNFRIEIPVTDPTTSCPPIPKELIERKAYLRWVSKGRPVSSPHQQKQDYDDAFHELQSLLAKGLSLDELHNSCQAKTTSMITANIEIQGSDTTISCRRRHDIGQWLQNDSKGNASNTTFPSSALVDLVEKAVGGDSLILRQSFHVSNYEIVVLLKVVGGDFHIVVAGNTKGATVLHWGLSKSSSSEWLAPPQDMLPKKSKLLDTACQTYFNDVLTGNGFFQFVDINLKQKKFVGILFIIWSGGSWIKHNGANFFVRLEPMDGQAKDDGRGIVKSLLDEISGREKEAERSLMHRFNIATELTQRYRSEGKLGLIGILVWMRFMACRQLKWNNNYNVKPREISEAQDRFTNLLQEIYINQPKDRETVRLIMGCVGRGGQGDAGQRIRDEILVLQRNNDCKGGMMEEWHQKLHNNSSPDDVIICEALLDYLRSGCKIGVYWQTLNAKGITKHVLASYDRPIVSEPQFRNDAKEGLIRDLTSYLKTLKAVHSGMDLESAIETCLGFSSKDHEHLGAVRAYSVGGLSPKLQDHLHFVKAHVGDKNIGPLIERLLESRIELRPLLLSSHRRLKELLFLDLALDSAVRTTVERALKDLNFSDLPKVMSLISLVLENLCLSIVDNGDLIYCTKDWYRIRESYKHNDVQWALQAKAVLDRVRLALADRSECYMRTIQPSVKYLGGLLSVEKWAIDIFTDELIRSGSAPSLSLLVNHLDPVLRKVANLGCWQIISPAEVCGSVICVNDLITIQNKKFGKPTIIVTNKVSGEEEIPEGAVAVLTPDMPDVLSHVSIRARNNKVLFASCFDQSIFRDLQSKEGKEVSIQLKSTSLVIRDIGSSGLSLRSFRSSSRPRGITFKKKTFRGKYAVSMEEFTSEMVGSKSFNIQFLRAKAPSWIKIPVSVALPFGVFETVLSEDINKDIANKISCFSKLVDSGDLSKLQTIQDIVLQMNSPNPLMLELESKMRVSRIPWPRDQGEERWNQAWQAIKRVWASKWNERAYISCRKAHLDHNNICMAVLIQEIISADYAFVIHTKNPLSGDTTEIYTEIVKGLGETLVGAYPGRAMSFITKKNNLKSPTVIGYPSKQIGLYIKRSLIFRSDSNGEDLEGYAGAGLYDSVTIDKPDKVVLDYSNDRMIVDKAFQVSLFSKIAEAGKTIEALFGCAQDIEGVVKDGEVYVVQSRPQI